jgi:ABC-2 type transport system ATP-binding protein
MSIYKNISSETSSPHAIACNQVCLRTKKKEILRNVTFEVVKGSITGLLGPNGAGKSSIMRMIAGLTQPDSGSIQIFGQPAGVEMLGQLAWLPDRGSLPGWLTAGEWLGFAKGIYPDWSIQQADKLIDSLKITLGSRISNMSRGEEMRLQLLTCLARTSPLIILDEPFTGVDMISREQIASSIVSELMDGIKTFLIATHDIREMENMFDHLILIDNGAIVGLDDVEQLRISGKSVESRYREVFA